MEVICQLSICVCGGDHRDKGSHAALCLSSVFVRQRQIKSLSEAGGNKTEFVLGNISASVALSRHRRQLPFYFCLLYEFSNLMAPQGFTAHTAPRQRACTSFQKLFLHVRFVCRSFVQVKDSCL